MKRFVLGDVFPDLESRGDIWRGWIVPVGGSTPDRLRSDRLGPVRDGGEEMRIYEKVCFEGCLFGFGIAGDIWRGWIVPVGGSTPDRHRKLESGYNSRYCAGHHCGEVAGEEGLYPQSGNFGAAMGRHRAYAANQDSRTR